MSDSFARPQVRVFPSASFCGRVLSPRRLKQRNSRLDQASKSSRTHWQFWLIGHMQRGEAMHHGDEQVTRLLKPKGERQTALFQPKLEELITAQEHLLTFF